MEIDEAIKNIKKLKSYHNGSYGTAINFAIKSLEQQPCEDCISREEAINLVHDLAQPCDDRYDWDISADEMIDGIKDLPSVTPKFTDAEIQKMQELEQVQLEKAYELGKAEMQPCEDCRNCKRWNECPCGKEGHENGTSIGYSIGECKDYEPSVPPKENDKLKYLKDRPCEVCDFHSDNGCRRWKCIFEEDTK